MPGRHATLAAWSKTPVSMPLSSGSEATILTGTRIPSFYERGSSPTVGDIFLSWGSRDMGCSSFSWPGKGRAEDYH